YLYLHPPPPHSFPTRRSSDLSTNTSRAATRHVARRRFCIMTSPRWPSGQGGGRIFCKYEGVVNTTGPSGAWVYVNEFFGWLRPGYSSTARHFRSVKNRWIR